MRIDAAKLTAVFMSEIEATRSLGQRKSLESAIESVALAAIAQAQFSRDSGHKPEDWWGGENKRGPGPRIASSRATATLVLKMVAKKYGVTIGQLRTRATVHCAEARFVAGDVLVRLGNSTTVAARAVGLASHDQIIRGSRSIREKRPNAVAIADDVFRKVSDFATDPVSSSDTAAMTSGYSQTGGHSQDVL